MVKKKWVASILLAGLLFSGCGEQEPEMDGALVEAAEALTSEVEVQKDGSIIETLVEDFSGDRYNEESLRTMVMAEVEDYNKGHEGTAVSLDKLEQKEESVTVRLKYPSAEAYSAYNTDGYNKMSLFCGTVEQAYAAGYSLDVTMQSAKGGEAVGKAELMEMDGLNILISKNPMRIKVDGRIEYVSGNVTVKGKDEALLVGGEAGATYYVLYK